MNVKSKHCKFTYHSFFYNKGNVAQCCMQDTLHQQSNWGDITDLNAWCNNLDEFNETRHALDHGNEHPSCESCWAYEADNIPSARTQNLYYTLDTPSTEVDIRHVDLRLSNHCNLQCKMCAPHDSDQLVKLAYELPFDNPLLKQLQKNNPEDIDKLLELVLQLPNLGAIRFAGGEPFIMPEVEQFLYKLVAQGRTNINIEFVTNCTSAKPKIIALLERFDSVELMCSIDGVEDTLEYQRYPARWSTIENNFKRMYNSKCNTLIVPCIGLLNYLDLDRFFAWAAQYPRSLVTFNEIREPSFLDFRLIPRDIRPNSFKLSSNVNDAWVNFVSNAMHQTRQPKQDECDQLKQYAQVWDYRCKEKFLDRYPWASYIIEKAIV
jgi:hypothetical protein